MRILLLTPPMTQINTPYPATAYLTGFLRSRGVDAQQADPSLELFLKLFSAVALDDIRAELTKPKPKQIQISASPLEHFLENFEDYHCTIDAVLRFLQGKDPTLAHRIVSGNYLPEGARFQNYRELTSDGADGLQWAFGALGLQDRALHMASLYIDDLSDVIRLGIDSRFELSRYAEKLAASAPCFDPILADLRATPSLVDRYLDEITLELIHKFQPKLVALTVPFPGNLYGALRMAQVIKQQFPSIPVAMGGGYVNTELRELSESRVFDFVDFITLDDGERPLLALVENLQSNVKPRFLRTLLREQDRVVMKNQGELHDIPFKDSATPSYDGLRLNDYPSLCELLNPMHRLWSDGRWNKLTLAHGCYWKKCSFCDTSLDYIERYEALEADRIVDHIENLIRNTGQSGFHFVDEAAPPKLLRAMSQRLLDRKVQISWWANIRFEKTFDKSLTELMAKAGCIAVSGGLEVASDRLLALMEKGVTVEQVARVTHAFSSVGIMVHAYLMFGFPTQTQQETIDSLERVRQLFEVGCIQSAFWHRFSATLHSPVGKFPERYGIRLIPMPSTFAKNDLPFIDPTGTDYDALHPGLKKALYNYMHGVGIEKDVRDWFECKVPKARVPRNLISNAIKANYARSPSPSQVDSLII